MQAAQQLTLPATGFLRVRQIIGDRTRGIAPLIPVCASTWHNGVRSGRYPASVKLGLRAVAWRVEDIRKLIENDLGAQS